MRLVFPEGQLRLSSYQTTLFPSMHLATCESKLGLIYSCPRCLQKRSLVCRESPCKMGLLRMLLGCMVSYHSLTSNAAHASAHSAAEGYGCGVRRLESSAPCGQPVIHANHSTHWMGLQWASCSGLPSCGSCGPASHLWACSYSCLCYQRPFPPL